MGTQQRDLPQEDFVASFAMQRQRLMYHAGTVLSVDAPVDPKPDTVSKLSQMLVTALEVLKVAEEELLDERRRNMTVQAGLERRLAHQQLLFDRAPAALLLTTSDSTIRESNNAANAIFGLARRELEGRQLSRMVPKTQQAAFRDQLAYAISLGRVAAWSFNVERTRSLPVVLGASVEVIDDPGVGAKALYWHLRQTTI